MSYFIYRNDQQYGPYTLQDLQSQVAGGTMVPADKAQSAQGGPWTTVGEILSQASQGLIPPAAPLHPGAVGNATVPLPPNLHWALVLLIGFFFGPFQLGWQIYQMWWVRKLDPENKSLLYFGIGAGVFVLLFIVGMVVLLHDPQNPSPWGALPLGIGFITFFVLVIMSVFEVRRSMLLYYNTTEPIGLRLSGVMTFFFNVYYFQHHMSRIATWKLTGYLAPQG